MRTPNGLRIFGAGISSSDKQRPAVAARVATRLWCGAPILYAMPASRELQRQLKRRELCLPRVAKRPPIGPGWIHEIKHGGVRILAERDAAGVTLHTPRAMTSPIAFCFALAAAAVASSRPVLLHGLDVLASIIIAILHDHSEAHTGILDVTVKPYGEANVAIALITGTSSGIGLATAVTLARGGHRVVATMRNLDGADELRKIVSAERLPITLAALNVDDDASVTDTVDKVLAENGSIDVLVNNAGVSSGGGSVEEVPIGAFRQVMKLTFSVACAALKP
jgi:short chain dehydrogenase